MSDLLLPAKVRHEIQKRKWFELRAERRALVARLLDFDDPVCREWQPVLAKLDPQLRLARAHPQAYEPDMNVKPGFYHWVRENDTAAPTVEPITGPDGESFAEPDSSLLRALERNDLQNPTVYAAMIGQHEEREKRVERELEEERAQINEEVLERWKAGTRTQVLLSPDVAWSQNASGRRGRKGT